MYLSSVALLKLNIPFAFVVTDAVPRLTNAPFTGILFSFTTRPLTEPVTGEAAGIANASPGGTMGSIVSIFFLQDISRKVLNTIINKEERVKERFIFNDFTVD